MRSDVLGCGVCQRYMRIVGGSTASATSANQLDTEVTWPTRASVTTDTTQRTAMLRLI